MGYASTVDTGQVQPLMLSSDILAYTGSTTALTANTVYLYAVEVLASVTLSGAQWKQGGTATGTSDVGIYTFAGNLLAHTGASTNTASANMSVNFSGGNLNLSPGQYFLALMASNSTDTYIAQPSMTTRALVTRCRQATNTGTAGVLPATTGGYSDAPSLFPSFWITVVGGLT